MQYQRLINNPEKNFFLFGVRGTGKSTWLRKHFPGALEINLLDESIFQSYLARPHEFAERVSAAAPRQCIVVDETQSPPQFTQRSPQGYRRR